MGAYDSVFLLALAVELAGVAEPAAVVPLVASLINGTGARHIRPGIEGWQRARDSLASGVVYIGSSGGTNLEVDAHGNLARAAFSVWSLSAGNPTGSAEEILAER